MGSTADTIAAELLVRSLRDQRLDARHISMPDLDDGSRPPDANPAAVAIAYLVSAFPSAEREHPEKTIDRIRELLPEARIVPVFHPGISIQHDHTAHVGNADGAVSSFVEAVQVCLDLHQPEAR
jgi:hypothetical protein